MTSFKQGMTLFGLFLCLFLLFPFSSKAGTYFLPDVQNEERVDALSIPPAVAVDSVRCEDIGYTYYSSGQCPTYHNLETCVFNDKYLKCDAEGWCRDNDYIITSCSSPKYLDSQCPNNLSLYKKCTCPSEYKYACTGTGYSSGNGTVCESKYTSCNCSTNYVWSGSACVCDSAFKYSCSGTGYSSGSGASCGGKYKSCNCSTYYSWDGSACVHYHSYSCASGYATSCSNGYYSTSPKSCTCGGSSGTCYACCSTSYKYTCSGTGYSGGSGGACNGKYTACSCASGYAWSGSACVRNCAVGYLYYSDGTCSASNNGKSIAGIVVVGNALVVSNVVYQGSWDTVNNLCHYHNPGIAYGQWRLPSDNDLFYYIHKNYSFLATWFADGYYWSSTEYEYNTKQAYSRLISSGSFLVIGKSQEQYAVCVLSI